MGNGITGFDDGSKRHRSEEGDILRFPDVVDNAPLPENLQEQTLDQIIQAARPELFAAVDTTGEVGDMETQRLIPTTSSKNNTSDEGVQPKSTTPIQSHPVTFHWRYGAVQSVFVAGSFNNWRSKVPLSAIPDAEDVNGPTDDEIEYASLTTEQMETITQILQSKSNDADAGTNKLKWVRHWSITLSIPAGQYFFKFIVDGQWRHDPFYLSVPDPKGNVVNMMLVLPPQPESSAERIKAEGMKRVKADLGRLGLNKADVYNFPNDEEGVNKKYTQVIPTIQSYRKSAYPRMVPRHFSQTIIRNHWAHGRADIMPKMTHVLVNHLHISTSQHTPRRQKASAPKMAFPYHISILMSCSQPFRNKLVTLIFCSSPEEDPQKEERINAIIAKLHQSRITESAQPIPAIVEDRNDSLNQTAKNG
ncbi:hypothetical protein BLNAU_5776 [Blattamonas nauphoetae]|uniref:AMP-activated protein kinase glycogen-binding domain-containing protein n=1 Tax=Blattamonas nauphoetae TaxID=2049346 RepID=A0ABQ9Y625_9EUKA|nr:hypothetical protein BLNAU_5776 [Blattamonas nauphoetae]